MTISKGLLSGGGKVKLHEKGVEQKKGSKGGDFQQKQETVDYVENEKNGRFFGIKSYLHQFYENSGSGGRDLDDFEGLYLLPHAPRRRIVYVCRVTFLIGLFMLIVGAVAILVGYLWPRDVAWSGITEQSMEENHQIKRSLMRVWKMVGLVVFGVGGFIIAVTLLIPVCCRLRWDEAVSREPPQDPIKIYPQISEDVPSGSPVAKTCYASTEKKIPMMEEIQPVQPKAGDPVRRLSDDEMLLGNEDDATTY